MIRDSVLIYRHEKLKELSREHHFVLLLCWKIRMGFKKSIEPKRIKNYVNWFYANNLKQHFEIEQQYIYPILDEKDKLVKRALKQQRRLRRLIINEENLEISLSLLEEELEGHVLFEERVLFKKIYHIIEGDESVIFTFNPNIKIYDEWEDKFWN